MTSQGNVWKSVAVGAVAGLAGAWAMNGFQALLSSASQPKQESQDKPKEEESDDATVKTAQTISETVFQHELTQDEKKWAGPAVHYGFGASVGAVYGALAETFPIATLGFGTAYGTAVWALGDELAVPALGLSQPASEAPASSHVSALAAHLVYGIVTDFVHRQLLKIAS